MAELPAWVDDDDDDDDDVNNDDDDQNSCAAPRDGLGTVPRWHLAYLQERCEQTILM